MCSSREPLEETLRYMHMQLGWEAPICLGLGRVEKDKGE